MKKLLSLILISNLVLIGCGGSSSENNTESNSSNTPDIIQDQVDISRTERAEQAQTEGYPDIWLEKNLPQYPGATIIKSRSVGTLTLETSDSPEEVKKYFDQKMQELGYSDSIGTANEFVAVANYVKDTDQLRLSASLVENKGITEILLSSWLVNN